MSPQRVLFIGGTGVISSACVADAVAAGFEVSVLNRGTTTLRPLPADVTTLTGDVRDLKSMRRALAGPDFDIVVQFLTFTADEVRADLELFAGRVGQYIFISSASAYQTPPARLPVTESTPLRNPFLKYSRDKIACEDLLIEAYRREGFPVT
ncbi:MAG: hypothetical protein JWM76_1485, partial [Pseudonocardiales bacterium]|nr:hypothetical protein [Pseudonocardiales bacterium]